MARKGRPQPPMGVVRQIDGGARAAFPALFTAVLIVLAAAPVGLSGLVAAAALPSVFFWTVFRPAAMPPAVVFLLGLLQDLLGFSPPGVGVLSLLLVHALALRGRHWLVKQSFLVVWLFFCLFAAVAAGLGWGLHALLSWQLPPWPPGLHQVGLAAGLYPALAWLLTRLHRAIGRDEGGA
jgi:rod shape-determining protein MreD